MVGFSVNNAEMHDKANTYINKFPQLLTLWWSQEIILIKKFLDDAMNEELVEGEEGIDVVIKLLNYWDWREIPTELDNDERFYIFESLLLRVRPREHSQLAREYVAQNWLKLTEQYERDKEILYLDDDEDFEKHAGITAKRINHTYELMASERLRNLREATKLGQIRFKIREDT